MKIRTIVPAPRLVCVEPNPGPRRSQRLSEEERWRVIHLSTEQHLSHAAIARKMGISRHTVIDILHKYHDIGTVRDTPRRGRPRLISEEEVKQIIKKAKKDKDATEIAREYEHKTGIKVSERTIQRIIREHGLQYLVREEVEEISEANEAKRLAYAQAMSEHNWKRVLFSDEKTWFLGAEKTRSWQEPGKRKKRFVKRHSKKINMWAAAGSYMKSKIYFFKQNMDSPLYQKIITKCVPADQLSFAPDCPARLPERYEFLQDNDPKHKAKKTMEMLRQLVQDRIIEHPAQSPDLNIMEDLWSHLDRKIKAAKITTIAGLKRKLTMEWNNMPWSVIRGSVSSMRARLAECRELQGGRTHY